MVMDSNFAQVYGAGNLAGKKPAGWFSRRHQTAAEHNHAVDVYGNRRARKARRVERARLNAEHDQVQCIECGGKHRLDRCYKITRVLRFMAGQPWNIADMDPAGTRDDKSLMAQYTQLDDALSAEIDFIESRD